MTQTAAAKSIFKRNAMELIDLSYPIDSSIRVHPYDAPAFVTQDKFLHQDGFNHHRLEIGMHTGTHIDSPMHITGSRKYINEYDLDMFCGRAKVLDVRGEDVISPKASYETLIGGGDIVLFYTGHEEQYSTSTYFTDHPVLDITMAEFLAAKNVRLAGFDLPSPDRPPYPIHKKLLENGILIIENLRNLKKVLHKEIRLYAFPLNIRADASIVRVVAETASKT